MSTHILNERFDRATFDDRLAWLHPPARWQSGHGRLRVEPAAKTDYWQRTHYGFQADNGPFLFTAVPGNFTLTTHVTFYPRHQYDQAGLMVRLSADCWLKSSVEYEPDGPAQLGAVVTNAGYSDWSTQSFTAARNEIWLRVRRSGGDYTVEYAPAAAADPPSKWRQIRLAHLHEDDGVQPVPCGLYASSPLAAGFVAEFACLRIEGHTAEGQNSG